MYILKWTQAWRAILWDMENILYLMMLHTGCLQKEFTREKQASVHSQKFSYLLARKRIFHEVKKVSISRNSTFPHVLMADILSLLGRQSGNTSFSDAFLFLISTDFTNHISLHLESFLVFSCFLLQPDKPSLIYSKRIYKRDWLTSLKSFRNTWKCDKSLNHRMNIRRRTTKYGINETKPKVWISFWSHYDAFQRPDSLLEHWACSTGSYGSEELMLDVVLNSCLVNSLPFI